MGPSPAFTQSEVPGVTGATLKSAMPAKVIGAVDAEHYAWGDGCDAWYLVRTPELNIIEEQMPAGAAETAHRHVRARQFFFVLAGELTLLVERQAHTLRAHQGLEIAPGEAHQAINRSEAPARFLVTSQPPSHGDRIDC
jgi:mannose-6-phosphate isomerase-like protein (cupin superfamily)